jgi:hypothetical protein
MGTSADLLDFIARGHGKDDPPTVYLYDLRLRSYLLPERSRREVADVDARIDGRGGTRAPPRLSVLCRLPNAGGAHPPGGSSHTTSRRQNVIMHSSHTGSSSSTGSHSVTWRRAQRSAGGPTSAHHAIVLGDRQGRSTLSCTISAGCLSGACAGSALVGCATNSQEVKARLGE